MQLQNHPITGELVPEIWKDIEDYEDYQISNYGRVLSKNRLVDKGDFGVVEFPEIILSQIIRKDYYAVGITRNKKSRIFSIHRLVATAFIPNPNNLPQVNHLDTIKFNNFYLNLEWCTPKRNASHAVEHGLYVPPVGEKNGQAVLTEESVRHIRSSRYVVSRKKLSEIYGVTIKHIDRVRSGDRWGHVI